MNNMPMKAIENEMQYNIQDSMSGKLSGKGMAYSNTTVPVSMMCSSDNMNNIQTAEMHYNTDDGKLMVPGGKGMNTGTAIHQDHQLQNLTQQPPSMSTSDVGASMQYITPETMSDTLANQTTISDVNCGVPVSMTSSNNQTNNVQMPTIGHTDSNNLIDNMQFATSGEPLGEDLNFAMLESNLEYELEDRLSTILQKDNEAIALSSTMASGSQTQNVPMASTETPEQYPSTSTSGKDETPVPGMDPSNERHNVLTPEDEDSIESNTSEESGEEVSAEQPQRSASPDAHTKMLCEMMDCMSPKSMRRAERYIRKTMSDLLSEQQELLNSISGSEPSSHQGPSQQESSRYSSELDGDFLCSMMDYMSPMHKERAELYIRKMMFERPDRETANANMTMVGSDPNWLEWLRTSFDELL